MYTRWLVDFQQVGLLDAPSIHTNKSKNNYVQLRISQRFETTAACVRVLACPPWSTEHSVNRMEQAKTLFVEPNIAIYSKRDWHTVEHCGRVRDATETRTRACCLSPRSANKSVGQNCAIAYINAVACVLRASTQNRPNKSKNGANCTKSLQLDYVFGSTPAISI